MQSSVLMSVGSLVSAVLSIAVRHSKGSLIDTLAYKNYILSFDIYIFLKCLTGFVFTTLEFQRARGQIRNERTVRYKEMT